MKTDRMRIALGVDRSDTPDTIRTLVQKGGDEFFAGYVPPEWYDTYGWEVSINRRENGPGYQFTRFDEISAAVRAVHDAGSEIYITINAHDYDRARAEAARRIIEDLESIEPDGYIVADPALMIEMRRWGVQRALHLSTGAGCFNSETVRWFADFVDFERVVIPRKLTLREMQDFVERTADLGIDYEVMIIGPRCYFNDEYCFTLHSANLPSFCARLGGAPIAQKRFPTDWKDWFARIGVAPADDLLRPGSVLDRFVKMVRWPGRTEPEPPAESGDDDGMAAEIAARFYYHCGLCAIPRLRQNGIHVLKVPVRGSSWAKERYTEIVRSVADNPDATPEFCRNLIGSPAYCADPESCYYHLD